MQQPRQIYSSRADRRHGRRWSRRQRSYWLPAAGLLAVAVVAGEALRGLG